MPEPSRDDETGALEADAGPTPTPVVGVAVLALLVAAPILRIGLSAMKNHAVWWTPDLLQTLLASISAETGQQYLGAWSRIGLAHPGPAWFYWAAPFVRLSGDQPWGLVMAASALAALSCALIVIRVGRVAGTVSALAVTSVLLVGLFQLNLLGVSAPWNPTILILPLTCGIVCLGEVLHRGSIPGILIASACGAIVAQAHLGSLPLGLALIAGSLIAGYVVRRRRELPITALGVVLVAAWAVVPWLPVAYDAVAGTHNAITTGEYVALGTIDGSPAEHPTGISRSISRRNALRQVVSVGSLAEPDVALWAGVDLPAGKTHWPSRRSIPAFALALIVTVVVARPRRRPTMTAQVARVALVALALECVAALRVRGEYRPYLIAPTAGIGLALWIVVGLAAADAVRALVERMPDRIPRRTPVVAFGALLAVSAVITLPRFDQAVQPGPPVPTDPAAVERIVAQTGDQPLRLQLSGEWTMEEQSVKQVLGPTVRLVLELKHAGVDVSVNGEFLQHFGNADRADSQDGVALVLRPGSDPPASGCRFITTYESMTICLPVSPAG